jgi:hypothetical protein
LIREYLKADIEQENKKLKEEEERWREKLNSLTVKIIYKQDKNNIGLKKTDLISKLKDMMIDEYELGKINKEDIRVRGYNISTNKYLEPYEGLNKVKQ